MVNATKISSPPSSKGAKTRARTRTTTLEPESSSSSSSASESEDGFSGGGSYNDALGLGFHAEDEERRNVDALMEAVRKQVDAQFRRMTIEGVPKEAQQTALQNAQDGFIRNDGPGAAEHAAAREAPPPVDWFSSAQQQQQQLNIGQAIAKAFHRATRPSAEAIASDDLEAEHPYALGTSDKGSGKQQQHKEVPHESEQLEIYSRRIVDAARPSLPDSQRDRASIERSQLPPESQQQIQTPKSHPSQTSSRSLETRDSSPGVPVPIDQHVRRKEQRRDMLTPAQRVQAEVDPSVLTRMGPESDDEDHEGGHKAGLAKLRMKSGLKKAGGMFRSSGHTTSAPSKSTLTGTEETKSSEERISKAQSKNSKVSSELDHTSITKASGDDEVIEQAPQKIQSKVSAGALRLLNASTDVLDKITGNLSDDDQVASDLQGNETIRSSGSQDSTSETSKGFRAGVDVKEEDRARSLLRSGKIEPVTETELVNQNLEDRCAKRKQDEEEARRARNNTRTTSGQRKESRAHSSERDPFIGAYPPWYERWSATIGLGRSDNSDAASLSTLEQERRAQQMRAFEKMEIEKFTRNFSKHVKEVRTLAFGNEKVSGSDGRDKPITQGKVQVLPTRWTSEARLPRAEDFLIREEKGGQVTDRADWIAFTIAYILALLENYTRDTLDEEPLKPYRMSTFRSHVERFYIIAPAWENILYGIRDLYRWEDPKRTGRYAMTYFVLWYLSLLPSAILLWGAYHLSRFRYFPPTASTLAEHVRQRRDRGIEAMRLSERLRRQTRLEIYELYLAGVNKFGSHGQMLLGDFVDLCEMVKNLILWRRPRASILATARFVLLAVVFAITPSKVLSQAIQLAFGIWFFAVLPLASHFPRYRRALNPFWWLLWGAPTDAQYCIEILRKEAEIGIKDGSSEASGEINAEERQLMMNEMDVHPGHQNPSRTGSSSQTKSGRSKSEILGSHFCFHKLLPGHLYVFSDHIKFKTLHGLAPKRKLCQVALADVVGIKKGKSINLVNLYASEGLEISLRDGSVLSFSNMARRDQAFNKLIAVSSRDHLWKKV